MRSVREHIDASDEIFDIGNQHGLDAGIRGCDATDGSIGIERQAVDTYFTMRARPVVEVVGIDAMVDDVLVVGAGDVHNGIMSSAIDAVGGVLNDDDGLRSHLDRSRGRSRCTVGHMIIG